MLVSAHLINKEHNLRHFSTQLHTFTEFPWKQSLPLQQNTFCMNPICLHEQLECSYLMHCLCSLFVCVYIQCSSHTFTSLHLCKNKYFKITLYSTAGEQLRVCFLKMCAVVNSFAMLWPLCMRTFVHTPVHSTRVCEGAACFPVTKRSSASELKPMNRSATVEQAQEASGWR